MGYAERKQIIEKIERMRDSKVITYFVSTREGVSVISDVMMEEIDLREFFRHLEVCKTNAYKNIDLFIYSFGGESVLAWALVNMIKEFSEKFSVMIPFYAFSCATSVAIGADEIIMCRTGILGPIDPLVGNEFNPIDERGNILEISVEDISSFQSLISDKFKIDSQDNATELYKILSQEINPLALGNAYRQYLKARDDARKLLKLHMDIEKDKEKIEMIIQTLVEKLYYHGHHITRREAKLIGLDIIDAETIIDTDYNLSDLLWQLYVDYEKELDLTKPYKDTLPSTGKNTVEIPVKYIESSTKSSVYVIEQEWFDFGFPVGSKISITPEGHTAIYDSNNKEIIPVAFGGIPVIINNKIYVKREQNYWK